MADTSSLKKNPDFKTERFEGPLDLLCYLIEKNKINIYDIPIIEITDQYLEYISGIDEYDIESTSSFLVMASTLLHIKSRMLLPSGKSSGDETDDDPREELVIKLLEYRRCKAIAEDLKLRNEIFKNCIFKMPEPPESLGVIRSTVRDDFSVDEFYSACEAVTKRNISRYNDVSARLTHILKREKISVKDKMKTIWKSIVNKTRVFFNEIFPCSSDNRPERVVGFLALLELLRINKIQVKQKKPFDVMLIEVNKKKSLSGDMSFNSQFNREIFEEITYK